MEQIPHQNLLDDLTRTMKQMVINGEAAEEPFLPEEIMTNILKRLPVKSLMQFQCVCKHRKSLFKTPSFIVDHLRHSTYHNPSLMFFQNSGLDPLQLHLLDCDTQVRDVQKPPPFDSLRRGLVSIIGSSNGLLCVTIRESELSRSPTSVLLWNPATRDVREVPRSRTIVSRMFDCALGFGFSSFVNDYKIVAITGLYGSRVEVRVYSLSRDSWKGIKLGNFLKDVDIHGESVVSSNGAIFWNAWERRVIVSFDIAKEEFNLIPWPPGTAGTGMSYFNLTVYKDKVAALFSGAQGSPNIELWVVEEEIGSSSRERWSWSKIFTGGPYPWTLKFGATIWRNEIVMSGTETIGEKSKKGRKSGLCRINVTTNEFNMLVIPNIPCDSLNYVESLVPVVNIRNVEEA